MGSAAAVPDSSTPDAVSAVGHCGSATANDLPNELILLVLQLLPLRAFVVARSINRRWRALADHAHLAPARRRLVDLFTVLAHTLPPESCRPRVHPSLRATDRAEYFQFLTRGAGAPEEFRLWVREWPAWAVFGWLWPEVDSDSDYTPSLAQSETWTDPLVSWDPFSFLDHVPPSTSRQKPHVKCLTFSGGKSPFHGDTLHATRILPVEFAELGIQNNVTEYDGDIGEPSIEVTALCFAGDTRALILDGKRGGEELAGVVYAISGTYAIGKDNILSRSWVEYLQKHVVKLVRFLFIPRQKPRLRLCRNRMNTGSGTYKITSLHPGLTQGDLLSDRCSHAAVIVKQRTPTARPEERSVGVRCG